MAQKLLLFSLLVFLLGDLSYSFLQHYHRPFDGDLAGGVVPAKDVKMILDNPLGFRVFQEGAGYPNPNKFFSHWSLYQYFSTVPFVFQRFTDPINAAYLAASLAKTLIQLSILLILTLYVTGSLLKKRLLVVASIMVPLFQTNGYQSAMGIIDPATTYVFFYALPALLLMIYFYPLYHKIKHGRTPGFFKYIKPFWLPMGLVSSLSGPLNPGITLIITLLLFMSFISENIRTEVSSGFWSKINETLLKIPRDYYFYLLPVSLFSLYSLYLGSFNTTSSGNDTSLFSLYTKLPEGGFRAFTKMIGYPLLILVLFFNVYIIKKFTNNIEGLRLIRIFKWVGIFTLIYIVLLPLGGYREYRPFLLRYDTILPITLMLFFIFGKMTLFLFKKLRKKQLNWYVPLILLVLLNFLLVDKSGFGSSACERSAIAELSRSKDTLVRLKNDCTVLSWSLMHDPAGSAIKTALLKKWNILEDDKLFYQSGK